MTTNLEEEALYVELLKIVKNFNSQETIQSFLDKVTTYRQNSCQHVC